MENQKELLEAIEKLLKADVLTAREYTQIVIRVKTSNDSAQGENSNVSDNEEKNEVCPSCNCLRTSRHLLTKKLFCWGCGKEIIRKD